jgi:hypothetical protein
MEKKKILAGLSIQDAEDLLHYCLGPDGEVVPGKHFLEELNNEQLELSDAWFVLRTGHIFSDPEPDIKTAESKYTVEGHETGGKYIAIVFSFKEVDLAFLITVFSIESLRRRGP